MSAFIVSDETINKVASWLYCKQNESYWPAKGIKEIYGLVDRQGFEKLAKDMFKLNVRAVDERYGEGEAKTFRKLNFKFRLIPPGDAISVYKALQCWLYQCSEGSVPERQLYKRMEKFGHLMAEDIVTSLPAYDAAPWD